MESRPFEGMETELTAPKGHEGRVLPLPVKRITEDGIPLVESVWRPSRAERAMLAEDADVVLTVWGRTVPPIRMRVAKVP